MLTLIGCCFRAGDRRLIRKFSHYVLNKFVKPSLLRNSRITIRFVTPEELKDYDDYKDLRSYKAWCVYEGLDATGRKKFNVTISTTEITRSAKSTKFRRKKVLHNLAHELVHVKQYLNGEMKDYVDGSYKFLGEKYDPIPDGEGTDAYYDSPAEIEAYGREQGLYRMFWKKLESEGKADYYG